VNGLDGFDLPVWFVLFEFVVLKKDFSAAVEMTVGGSERYIGRTDSV